MQSEVVLGMSMSAETEILDSPGADAADRIITHKKKKKVGNDIFPPLYGLL